MATPPPSNPPPLAHITTALRQDNRSLLLSTLQYDPRTPSKEDDTTITTPYQPPDNKGEQLQRQNLIFGTSHLRRTLLRNVLARKDDKTQQQRGRRKQKGNKTQVEEEEEMMSDLNEELLGTIDGGLNGESFYVFVLWDAFVSFCFLELL
jgi:hypothetical protein